MPAAAPRLTYIPDLLEEHVEEIEFLWGQRQAAITSPRYTMRELAHLDERIQAHVQGVLAVGDQAKLLLEQRLAADTAAGAFSAAYPLLQLGPDSAAQVLQAFSQAEGPRLDGLTQALRIAASKALLSEIASLLLSAGPTVAVAAAEVLVVHKAYDAKPGRLLLLVQEEDPAVRLRAWRVAGYLGVRLEPKLYGAAMRDEEPAVRAMALFAAAWSRLPGALALVRQLAQAPTPENLDQLRLLAILGAPQDLAAIAAMGRSRELGPARFSLVASFGHPSLVDLLIAELANPEPEIAAAAAEAFTRMTGQSVDSGDRVKSGSPTGQADEFENEFQDELMVPSPELARKQWAEQKPRLGQATRLSRGLDISRNVGPEILGRLDLPSRWEACLRGRFEGTWAGSAYSLEAFPCLA